LAGTGQGNIALENFCRIISCIIIKEIENKDIKITVKAPILKQKIKELAVAFVDYTDFTTDRENSMNKI